VCVGWAVASKGTHAKCVTEIPGGTKIWNLKGDKIYLFVSREIIVATSGEILLHNQELHSLEVNHYFPLIRA